MAKMGSSMIRTLDVRVTARQSVVVKMGRDDAPLAAPLHFVSREGTRDHLAVERANTVPTAPVPEIRTYAERDGDLFLNTDGHVVRTVAMGDATLPTIPKALAQTIAPPKAKRGDGLTPEQKARKTERRGEREQHDAQILQFLRAKGYTGSLTSDIRALALDALEAERQVREYAAG